jgi:poly-beta-1,6 N-acetyl-D-glucosamine synthase
MNAFIEFISLPLLVLLVAKVFVFSGLSVSHYVQSHKKSLRQRRVKFTPEVSVIVPAYNEGLVVVNCVKSLLKQTYKNLEIIIVDDGSSDDTRHLGEQLQEQYASVRFYAKKNGGKASALNHGIARSSGEIIVCIDADSIFIPGTIKHLVESFIDPLVGAVGGNVKVANRENVLSRHQATEYVQGLTIQRKAFAFMNSMTIISGAIGAFRKEALDKIGGYSSDTLVEDMDITLSIARAGYKIEYNPRAIAYTEAPENIGDFLKQRQRWVFGGLQILKKHQDMIFNPEYREMGMLSLPYFMIFPWIDVLISLLFGVVVIHAFFVNGVFQLVEFYLLMTALQGLVTFGAILMDKEDKKLLLLIPFESLWYSHVISFATVKAATQYLAKVPARWNKLERLGKNLAPQS